MATPEERLRRSNRRRASRRSTQRRRRDHLISFHHGTPCECRLVYQRHVGCRCNKRRHGSPRVFVGCKEGRSKVYIRRAQSRQLKHLICQQNVSPWDDEVAALTNLTVVPNKW